MATTVLTVGIGVVLLSTGTLKLLAVPAMRERAEHLGYSVTAFRAVGATEVVAVAALWWGHILGPEVLGVAAAVGLVVLMAGAVASHLRAGDTPRATAPAVVVAVLLLALLALGVSP